MNKKLQNFLTACGIEGDIVSPMTPGASFRNYWRVVAHGKSYVVMGIPVDKPLEDGQSALDGVIAPFLAVGDYLTGLGIRSPEVYHCDKNGGFLLLEDFGNNSFYHEFSQTSEPDLAWYHAAIDVLLTIANSKPTDAGHGDFLTRLPKYNKELATIRGDYFLEDYLPALRGGYPSSVGEIGTLRAILGKLYEKAIDVPWGMMLWDYHSPNLMQLEKAPRGQESVGVIDFQDAKYGPISYDLASLLFDARYPFPQHMREDLLNYFMDGMENWGGSLGFNFLGNIKKKIGGNFDVSVNSSYAATFDREKFVSSFMIMGLLRNIGVVGRFARLAFRDGKKEFLPKIEVVWPYIDEALALPDCHELREFLEQIMPEGRNIAV